MFDCHQDTIRWSSVEEDLPISKLPVLFWVMEKTADHMPGCYVGWYDEGWPAEWVCNNFFGGMEGRWYDIYGNDIYEGVTHWSPLPKGPDCTLQVGLKIRDRCSIKE